MAEQRGRRGRPDIASMTCNVFAHVAYLLSVVAMTVAQGEGGSLAGVASPSPTVASPSPTATPSSGSSCPNVSAPLTAATGVITDGSGPESDYLASTNCTWIVRPSAAAARAESGSGITLVFEDFNTVFDDDFLFVTDASDAAGAAPGPELGLYTGILPTPMAVHFANVTALRLNFLSRGNNRDRGFVVRYMSDGTCHNDCKGGGVGPEGTCDAGLCTCDDGWTGADCSLRLEPLASDGVPVSGTVGVGQTRYYHVKVPSEPPNLMLKIELEFPDGDSNRARPLLMVANASAGGGRGRPGDGTFFDKFYTLTGGDCGSYPGCHWAAARAGETSQANPKAELVGPTNTYRLGGQPLINQDIGRAPFGLFDATLSALPTPDYFTFKDYRSWDLHTNHHHLYVTNQEYSPEIQGTSSNILTAGDWIIGVTNTEAIPLPAFLAQSEHFGRKWWGARPGFGSAVEPVDFFLSATLSGNADDMCLMDCGGAGTCEAGMCKCPPASAFVGSDEEGALRVGDHCEYVAEELSSRQVVAPPSLPIGSWAYFYVLFDATDDDNLSRSYPLVVELAYPGSPASAPMVFATKMTPRAGSDTWRVPRLESGCASFWGSGPYGDTHCHITGFDADFQFPPTTLSSTDWRMTMVYESGMDYGQLTIPPEEHVEGGHEGYFIAVLNHPMRAGASLEYTLRASFANPEQPWCPFDCLGRGRCVQHPGNVVTTSRPLDVTAAVDAAAPDWTCDCSGNATGAFCQDTMITLPLGMEMTTTLANGDWNYFVLDVSTIDPNAAHVIVVEMRKVDRDAFPLLFVKHGGIPAAFAGLYSPAVRTAIVTLNPAGNGRSYGALGEVQNTRINLTGSIPPNARVVGLRYAATLETNYPSFASEACFAFETSAGYVAMTCPSVLSGPGKVEVTGDSTKVAPAGHSSSRTGMNVDPAGVSPVEFEVGKDGSLTLELFESYNDLPGGGGQNPSADLPDAVWEGTLTVLYHEQLAVGHDYQDVESAYCTGVDCAVEDEHEVIFTIDPMSENDDPGDGRYYVGVYNSRIGTTGATLSQHESARFSSDMTYTIRASAFPANDPVCLRNCTGGHGRCTAEKAPICDCDVGFFGVVCSIAPSEMPLVPATEVATLPSTANPAFVSNASGYLSEGHFSYHYVNVPADAKSLKVTLSHPLHQRSHPKLFVKRDTIPVYCASIQGAATDCVDDFDASDVDSRGVAPRGEIVWASDGTARVKSTIVVTTLLSPSGISGGDGSRAVANDVSAVAAEINKREAEWALSGPHRDGGLNQIPRPSQDVSPQEPQPADEGGGYIGVYAAPPQRWYFAVYNDILGQSALTFTLDLEVSSSAECVVPDCSNHGACDTSAGVCVCDAGYLGASCAARVTPLDGNAALSHDQPLAAGEFTFFRFSVNCSGQDMQLVLTKKSSSGNGTTETYSSEADSRGTGSEVELAMQFGALPTVDDGGYLDGAVSMQDEADAWIDLSNAAPGVYYAVVHVSAGEPLPGFTLRLTLRGSRVPNEFNKCEYADDRLVMEVTTDTDAKYTRLGPVTGSTTTPFIETLFPADIYEPAYGHCGTKDSPAADLTIETESDKPSDDVPKPMMQPPSSGAPTLSPANGRHCYIGDEHSSGRVRDLPQARGHGLVQGRVVLGRATPMRNDQDYYYLYGDIRKHPGVFDPDAVISAGAGGDFATFGFNKGRTNITGADAPSLSSGKGPGASATRPVLMFQGEKGAASNYDLEGCDDLINAEEIRGNVCVVARGSCYFSSKTLACQRAGAVAAIIVNTDMNEGAEDNWVSSHDPGIITIPTISYGGQHANQMLREMYDVVAATASTTDAGATEPIPDDWFYTRTVSVKIFSYKCDAPSHCPACGHGLASVLDNCTSASCPGMNEAHSVNCSGRGVGPNGGCSLVEGSFECTCAVGFAGAGCELVHPPPEFTDTMSISSASPISGGEASGSTAEVESGANFTFGFRAVSEVGIPVVYVLEAADAPGARVNPRTGEFVFDTSHVTGNDAAMEGADSGAEQAVRPRRYAFRIAAVDELGGKNTTDFTVTVLPSPEDALPNASSPAASVPANQTGALPPVRIPDEWASAIAKVAGGSVVEAREDETGGTGSAADAIEKGGDLDDVQDADVGKGGGAALTSTAAAGLEGSGSRGKKMSGAKAFGVAIGTIAGAACLVVLGTLAWRRKREMKRRENVLRQVNMTQL